MMEQYRTYSYLFGGNAPYVEALYEDYLINPSSVSDYWRAYFDTMQNTVTPDGKYSKDVPHTPVLISFVQRGKQGPIQQVTANTDLDLGRKQVVVQQIIEAYRNIGSRWADIDPLKRQERPHLPELDPLTYGFTEADLDITFNISNTFLGKDNMTLRELLQDLRATYCDTLGIEYTHISDQTQKRWWQEKLEPVRSKPNFSNEQKKHILERLTAAEGLERYLHTKYVGQKRFSLEGGDSFIAAMDALIQCAGKSGMQEVVIGMSHRGRLNVLINILGKSPKDLFAEFEGRHAVHHHDGDVKYHQGFSSDVSSPGGPVHLSLAFNPSHLEIVNPVVEGSVKARQEKRGKDGWRQVLPVLVHGDAAFAGQGVVMESLNLAQTRGYGTGGTVHIVINNQIGFTTSDPRDARSTIYCTDVVKMIEVPVLHVNGDDPERVVFAIRLALAFRNTFKHDVVVDIVCFRKLGHNEQDTPAMTQPMMYKKISEHPGTRHLYAQRLLAQDSIDASYEQQLVDDFRAAMDAGVFVGDPTISDFKNKFAVDWIPFLNREWTDLADTAVPLTELKRLSDRITAIPETFSLHPLVAKIISDRRQMGEEKLALDWGMGEHLAFASLVSSHCPVRITGQDCGRGTFTHRHAVLHDQNRESWDNGTYIPLQNIAPGQASFTIIDSVLSEEAVLGFEYGYSTAEPNALVIWEAQFGDFVNGAQVIIDQFIASGEAKWGRACGLTMMLPHGYEGQGPEHSSARPERFLQLCTGNNIQVCQPTTPAQIFHLLRRQMLRLFRKPLIILTPKSLLRHKSAVSQLADLAHGGFETIIDMPEIEAKKVKRLILCSGRVYYDLLKQQQTLERHDVAIVRIEQLYPFPKEKFAQILRGYTQATEIVWCQDEPRNQGYWSFIQPYIQQQMTSKQKLIYAGRPPSASPAVGYFSVHNEQQKALLDAAFHHSVHEQAITSF